MCRNSSVGRARDWKSLCPWFNSELRHIFLSIIARVSALAIMFLYKFLYEMSVNRWVIWFFQIVGLFGKVSLFRAFEGSEIIKLSVFQNGQNTLLRVRRIVVFWGIVHCFYLLLLNLKPFSPVRQIVWLFGICPFWVFWFFVSEKYIKFT